MLIYAMRTRAPRCAGRSRCALRLLSTNALAPLPLRTVVQVVPNALASNAFARNRSPPKALHFY